MNKIETPSLTFSHEELVLLLRALGVPTMPGVGAEPLAGLTPEQSKMILSSAERSLKARRIITSNSDNTLSFERFALALIGPCSIPEMSIIATRTIENEPPSSLYFHLAQQMIVEHNITGPGLHTFTALLDRQVLVDRLFKFLWISEKDQLTTLSDTLTVNLLREIIEHENDNGLKKVDLLKSKGIDQEFAYVLGIELSQLQANSSVVVVNHLPEEEKDDVEGVSFLDSKNTFWVMKESSISNSEEPAISIESVSSEHLKSQIQKWILQ